MLELKDITKTVDGEVHLHNLSMKLEPGAVNVLLGPTRAGKTTLIRLMAGLEPPSSGSLFINGKDVTNLPVQKRKVALVYQQFINYPSLSTFENIASPLYVAKIDKKTIKQKVESVAELLGLEDFLNRMPLSLSGGQQQRIAIARAIVKEAELIMLDEPLVNLDYKLREELREELPKIFAKTNSIFVYATTEPGEALLLGGKTATLFEGKVTQFAKTIEVYRNPVDLTTARIFSDPPLNTCEADKQGDRLNMANIASFKDKNELPDQKYILGFHPHCLRLTRKSDEDIEISAQVKVTELTGSESFIHLNVQSERWVLVSTGVHDLNTGTKILVYLDPDDVMIFNPGGARVSLSRSDG